MTAQDAIDLVAGAPLGPAAQTWADLGCGDGAFTMALASLLPAGSTIHALDRDRAALARLPAAPDGTAVVAHAGDFTRRPWPFGPVDGVLMANALHYVRDRPAFVRGCRPSMRAPRRFLVVEYDTDTPNAWVPYPLSFATLAAVFGAEGFRATRLGTRSSRYQRPPLYAAWLHERPAL
jgi:trans-aconitate methyltransferase